MLKPVNLQSSMNLLSRASFVFVVLYYLKERKEMERR
jgi:hypothetical protein